VLLFVGTPSLAARTKLKTAFLDSFISTNSINYYCIKIRNELTEEAMDGRIEVQLRTGAVKAEYMASERMPRTVF